MTRKDINSLKDIGKRKSLKQERNRVQKQIKDLKRKDINRILKEQISEIEACKNDSIRLFATMRILYRKHPSDLLIEKQGANNHSKKTVTACPRQQVQLITNHFNNVFNNQDEPGIPRVEPVKIKTPFSEEEVVGTVGIVRICSHQAELVNLCGLSRPSSFLFYVQRTRSQSECERETRYLLTLDYHLWTKLIELKYRLIYFSKSTKIISELRW